MHIKSDAQIELWTEIKQSPPGFKFTSRPLDTKQVDDTPGPNTYFYLEVPSSLNGPKYSFAKVDRDFKSVFSKPKIDFYHKRKNSLQMPKVSLKKYRTKKVVDTSIVKEREIKQKAEDRRDFYAKPLQPTTPSYTFK